MPRQLEERMPLPCGHVLVCCPYSAKGEEFELAHQKIEIVRDSWNAWLSTVDFKPERVLEFGVCRGGSLALWNHLWGCEVVGVDCDLEQVTPQCHEHYAKCIEEDFTLESRILPSLDRPNEKPELDSLGTFDLIIDDGEHGPESIFATLELAWPLLHPGGFYVVEDWFPYYLQPERTKELVRTFAEHSDGRAKSFTEFPALLIVEKRK